MRHHCKCGFLVLVTCCLFSSCQSQPVMGTEHLQLLKEVSLPGVKGRLDHMDVNLKDQVVYMAALGNNTLEVIHLPSGKALHSITGLDEPQGVGYIPQHQEIFVANGGSGACYFYDARTFEKKATVKLSSDADDVRYDSLERKIYVGYGAGGIAVIDADSHQQVADIKLPAHPEGFQLDKALHSLYVNLPDDHSVGVVDLKAMKLVKRWSNNDLSSNFPMASDTSGHRIFVGYRRPAKLEIINTQSGNPVGTVDIVGDTDDLYYDPQSHRVYISGGNGTVNIFQEEGHKFIKIANVATRSGARTSLLIPMLHLYVVGVRAASGKETELLVYQTK